MLTFLDEERQIPLVIHEASISSNTQFELSIQPVPFHSTLYQQLLNHFHSVIPVLHETTVPTSIL